MPFLSVNGKQLFVALARADEGPENDKRTTILCIHGLGSAHSFYSSIIPEVTASGYDFVAYDTYGSGQSKFQGGEQSVTSMARDVEALIRGLKLESSRTILVGHSMGGMVACDVASRLELLGVVLLGPVHPSPAMGPVFSQRIENVMKNGVESLANTIPKAATGSKATQLHRAFVRALIMSQEPEGYASLCKVIADAKAPDYAAVKCPVLIIAGADDKTAPLSSSDSILQGCGTDTSRKEIEVLDGVGHWHCVEAGEAIGPRVVQFAKSWEVHNRAGK